MKLYDLENFGKELKTIRLLRELSQKEVSEYIGTSQDTLRRLENGYSIPKLETIDYLSILYKIDVNSVLSKHRLTYGYLFDKDIAKFNDLIVTRENGLIHDIIGNIDEVINSETHKPTDQLMQQKLIQFKEFIDFYMHFESGAIANSEPTEHINTIVKFMKISIPDFEIKDVHLYHYDYIEMRLLLLLSTLLRRGDRFSESKYVLFALEENALIIKEYSSEINEILSKVYFNLAYLYHRIDDHEMVIESCDKGMKLSKESNYFSVVQHFLFRKAVAYNGLGDEALAKKYFHQTLAYLDIMENHNTYNHFKDVIVNKYKIEL